MNVRVLQGNVLVSVLNLEYTLDIKETENTKVDTFAKDTTLLLVRNTKEKTRNCMTRKQLIKINKGSQIYIQKNHLSFSGIQQYTSF